MTTPERPFRLPRVFGSIRDAWLMFGITLVLILCLEAGLRGLFAFKDGFAAPPRADPRLVEAAGGEWWPVHNREIAAIVERWEPFAYFRPKPFRGSTITIGDDGRRVVPTPPTTPGGSPRKSVKIAFFGGSCLWGYGNRDDATIPAHLVRMLAERGFDVDVRNYSQIGYVNMQEVVTLIRELQAGYRPDVVVFYDGVNDTTSAAWDGRAGVSINEGNRATEFNLLQSPRVMLAAASGKILADSAIRRAAASAAHRLFGTPIPVPPSAFTRGLADVPPEELARKILDAYETNARLVDGLAERFGFRVVLAWQPCLVGKARPSPVELEAAAQYAWITPAFAAVSAELDRRVDLKSLPEFVDLRGVFGDSEETLYTDYCHTTERATPIIAERLVEPILNAIRAPER